MTLYMVMQVHCTYMYMQLHVATNMYSWLLTNSISGDIDPLAI